MLAVLLLCNVGCARLRVTDPPRTATEQFLLSQAAIEAVEQISLEALRGRRVYVDGTYFAGQERDFVLGEFRAKAFRDGLQLVPLREEAQVVVEVRSGGVGIDRSDLLVGIPEMAWTGDVEVARVPIVTPELALLKNIDQMGFASVAYVAYWRESGEFVAASGPFIGRTRREDWWFFGWGPRSVGDIPTVREEEVVPEALSEDEPLPAGEPLPEVRVDEEPVEE